MADLQKALTEDLSGVPFRTVLSLKPLIDFWTRLAERQDSAKGAVARVIAAEVAKVAYERGLATGHAPNDMLAHIQSHMYEPDYRSYVPI